MASQVQIAQLALDSIGARSSIASLSENSAEARVISRQYDQALEDVLAAAHWNFARKQVALTLLKDATTTPADDVPAPWLYEYAYPADCVGARYVMPSFVDTTGSTIFGLGFSASAAMASSPGPVRFIIGSDDDENGNPQRVILTNQPEAVLVYTYRVTNSLIYDGPFVRALANYLGALICIAVNGDKALARMAFGVADTTTKQARVNNGNEGITVIESVPDWLQVRGVSSPANGQYVQSPTDLSFIA